MGDLEKLKQMYQPMLVNEQLNQLLMEMELNGQVSSNVNQFGIFFSVAAFFILSFETQDLTLFILLIQTPRPLLDEDVSSSTSSGEGTSDYSVETSSETMGMGEEVVAMAPHGVVTSDPEVARARREKRLRRKVKRHAAHDMYACIHGADAPFPPSNHRPKPISHVGTHRAPTSLASSSERSSSMWTLTGMPGNPL